MRWDLWTLSPEPAHQVTWLVGDRGIPRSGREMNGDGSHTDQWINVEDKGYRFNRFDLTKVWPQADYPRIKVGTMELNRNPQNYFGEIEQAAFSPSNLRGGAHVDPVRAAESGGGETDDEMTRAAATLHVRGACRREVTVSGAASCDV
jgi:catalase